MKIIIFQETILQYGCHNSRNNDIYNKFNMLFFKRAQILIQELGKKGYKSG
jgi:hypothetical protein